jgi:hypothetical protein
MKNINLIHFQMKSIFKNNYYYNIKLKLHYKEYKRNIHKENRKNIKIFL